MPDTGLSDAPLTPALARAKRRQRIIVTVVLTPLAVGFAVLGFTEPLCWALALLLVGIWCLEVWDRDLDVWWADLGCERPPTA